MTPRMRWSLIALGCFALALLAVLAANVPPGRSAPMVCFTLSGVFAVAGVAARFCAARELRREAHRTWDRD